MTKLFLGKYSGNGKNSSFQKRSNRDKAHKKWKLIFISETLSWGTAQACSLSFVLFPLESILYFNQFIRYLILTIVIPNLIILLSHPNIFPFYQTKKAALKSFKLKDSLYFISLWSWVIRNNTIVNRLCINSDILIIN